MHLHLSILIFIGLKRTVETVSQGERESYCSVRQSKFSNNFDFTELTNINEDYIIKHKEYNFLKLQLCKPLKDKCSGSNDTAVCHYNGNKRFAIGKEPPEVLVEFGQTIFKYTGEKCKSNRNYTVNIEMICDFTAKETNRIKWFPNGDNDCEYNLQWRTINACAERQQIKCSVHDKSGHYDLSSLINYSDNYEVYISNKYLAVLNVCHSVLYRPNSCHSNNAACVVSSDNPSDSMNLGIPTEDLKYNSVNKSLTLTYTNGAICTSRNVSANHIQTTITFFCDANTMKGLPEYVGGMEKCHYQFKWITAAACSEEVLKKKSLKESSYKNCSVQNPLNNYIFNLSSLINREFSVNRFGMNEYYKFSICSPLAKTTCAAGSGICQINSNISGGVANSNLTWQESGLYLNYTNGSLCKRSSQQAYTIIEFYCDEKENYEIQETDNSCHYKIKMSTKLACEKSTQSCVTYNNEVNLESLKLELSNYVIKSQDAEYHINVCNSLVKEDGLNCPNGTAICKFTHERGKVIDPISLGYPSENLIRNTDRSAVLIYRNGSTCEENKMKKIESSISFLCDISNRNGMPNLSFYKDCTYFFEWRTELVCGFINGQWHEQNCSISNGLGDSRDLLFLQESLGSQYIRNNRQVYNISLCGQTYCKEGFICTNELNYGTNVNVFFDYSVNLVRIHFTQGTKCKDGSKAKSSITLICKEEALSTRPVVIKEEACNVEFEWQTSKICQNQNYTPNKNKLKNSLGKNQTNIINKLQKSITKVNDTGINGELKLSKSTDLSGGVIVGIIVIIAFIAAAVIVIVKRWNPSFTNFSIFAR